MVIRRHFEYEQSAVTVICDEIYVSKAIESVIECHDIIARQIATDPFFGTTFEPYLSQSNHLVIEKMCQASMKSNVGPMASVAGAIAEYAVNAVIEEGSTFIIIDNGGDIALHTDKEVTIGLNCSDNRLNKIGLRIKPCDGVLGVCTSSGKIGPSISFGNSELSTVISENVVLADALATHLGNLTINGEKETLNNALKKIIAVEGVIGALTYVDGNLAMLGNVPKLVKVESFSDLITRRIHLHEG